MFCKIRQSLNTLKKLVKSHKKHLVAFTFLAVFFWFLYPAFSAVPGHIGDGSFAFASPTDPVADANVGGVNSIGFWMGLFCGILLTVAAFFLKLAIFCLAFVIEVAGYNGYLDSTAVNIGWVMVRDVTNMFFVVVLLLVAFGTILGLEQYEWKKMLVKFFFAAILVNFSRTICGIMIDVSQVVTITFVNGIAATAGGNLINALNLQGMFKMAETVNPQTIVSTKEIFASSLGALVFSAITLGMMMVFVFMLLSRLIVLWVLIVLSPFAFVLSVIPQTEKYASQWWSEFGNHVLVGPVTVFFIWLAFAVVGGGGASDELAKGSTVPNPTNNSTAIATSDAFNYNSVTNFAIAIGILLVGARTAQSLGSVGGSAMSKATDFGKKVAMVGSGVAAGMWAGRTAKSAGVSGVKLAYQASPVADWVERAQNYGKTQLASWKAYRAEGPTAKTHEVTNADGTKRTEMVTEKVKVKKQFATGRVDTDGNPIMEEREVEEEKIVYDKNDKRSWFQKQRYGSRMALIQSRKALEKTEKTATNRDEIMDKSVTAIPKGWFMRAMPDGFDRVEEGMLAAMKERSAAKTKEFSEYGRQMVLGDTRYKDGKWDTKKGTIGEQIVEHEAKATRGQEQIKQLMADYKKKYLVGDGITAGKGADILQATIAAKLETANLEKATTLNEGEMKTAYLRDNERGREALRQQTKLAEQEKEEHAVLAGVEKKAQAAFLTSGDGRHLLETTKAEELKTKASEAAVKEEEAKAEKAALEGPGGPAAIKAQKEAEMRAASVAAQTKAAEEAAATAAKQAPGAAAFLDRQKRAELAAKVSSGVAAQAEADATKRISDTPLGKAMLSQINVSAQGKKAAEDFVKGLEEKDLQEHFEKAAKKMNDILAMGDTDIDAMKAEEAAASESNPFIRAMTEAARLKETTDESGMRRRMAADAATNIAVAKPLYGTTTPSTAYTDYMESKMKEFKSLDRSAAAQKANQVQAELSWQKKRAEASAKSGLKKGQAGYHPPLTIGQNAQLLAANTYLQSEAWNDDQHGNMLAMFKKLKKGDLGGHEKEIWESLFKDVEKLGWVKSDGTIDATYSRQQAADSQALALTGNDVDLRAAHNAIARVKEQREREKTSALSAKEEEVMSKFETDRQDLLANESSQKSINDAVANAQQSAKDLGLDVSSGDGLALVEAEKEKAKRSILKADEGIALALKTHLETEAKKYKTGYGEVAEELFTAKDGSLFDTTTGQAKFEGIASVDDLKARYALHQDALQDGTKSNKKFAMENGHGELGYNTDNDEDWKMYRFTTNTEGESSIASERAKQKTKTLIDSDQKHATGKLDQATGIMDYLMTTVMSKSFGSAEKALDLKDMPARQVAAAFMRLSEEDAILRTDDRTGNKVGVLAGGAAAQTHLASLGKPPEKIRDHLLAASVTSKLLAGPLGYALLASKNYGHTNEMQARRGVINEDIGGVVAETVQQLATQILSAYEKDKANFFVGTEHQGNEKEVVRRLRQIQVTKFEIKDESPRPVRGGSTPSPVGGATPAPESEATTASTVIDEDERGTE